MPAKNKTPVKKDDFGEFSDNPGKLYEIIERLSEENTQIKDDRLEERFLWCLVITILIDAIIFPSLGLSSPLILLLEIALLTELGKRWQVENVTMHSERLSYWITEWCKSKKNLSSGFAVL